MAGTELGQAFVQIMPSAKGIGKSLKDELGNELPGAGEHAGKKMGGSLISTIGKVVLAAGIGKLIAGAMTAGGELQQNLGGTEAVFGTFANNVQTTAKDAYKNMGLSASDYMATANKMGSLFQGSGVEQERALALTSDAMQRAADVASVMGVDTTMAMESIAGAAKGNFTMMDNLGVSMNATSLDAYALEKGINFDWKTADNAEKAELAMKMFMDRTSQYSGNFAKESTETFSGSLGAMKSSFQDMLATLATGGDMGPVLENLGGTIVTFAKNLLPMISNVVKQLPTILVNLISTTGPELMAAGVQAIVDIGNGIGEALPTLIPQALNAILTIVDTLITNIPMLIDSGMTLLIGLAQGLMDALPQLVARIPDIITNLVTALTDGIPFIIQTGVDLLVSLLKDLPTIISTLMDAAPVIIESIITALLDNIPYIIQSGVELLTALIENLPKILVTIANAMPKIISSITKTLLNNIDVIIGAGVSLLTALIKNLPAILSALTKAMPQIISALVSALSGGVGDFIKIGGQLLAGLGEGISGAVGGIVRKAKEAAQKVVNSVKNFFGIASPSKVFAEIGEFLDAGLAEGIADNTKPITRAMDEVGALTTKSFESELAFNATTSKSGPAGLAASLKSGIRTQDDNGLSGSGSRDSRIENLLEIIASKDLRIFLDSRELGRGLYDTIDDLMTASTTNSRLATGGAF